MIRDGSLPGENTSDQSCRRSGTRGPRVAWTPLVLIICLGETALGQAVEAANVPLPGDVQSHARSPSEFAQPPIPDTPSHWIAPDARYAADVEYGPEYGPPWTEPVPGFCLPPERRCPRLLGLFCPPVGRHRGMGEPLLRESWRFRPFSAGWFMGAMQGSPLISDWLYQTAGFSGGYRFGWDFDDYWGCETRFTFAWMKLADSARAIAAQQASDGPFGDRYDRRRDSDVFLWDVSFLYYPWGDATWRPYLSAGLGAARIDSLDRLSVRRAETVFALPVGVGLKYRCNDRIALRADVTDNIAFGNRFNTLHELGFTGGVEIRFGGTRKAYWPWHPGRHYW